MQDGLEADLLNFLLGQPESRGKAHANTINLLVPFESKRNAMFLDHVALQIVIAFHAVVSVKHMTFDQLASGSEKHKMAEYYIQRSTSLSSMQVC